MAGRFDGVLCAVDAVVRVEDEEPVADLERRYELSDGALAAAIAEPEALHRALTGELPDEQWRAAVAAALVPVCGADTAVEVVADWSAHVGRVDEPVLGLLRRHRADGVRVALIANATTRLELDLVLLGLVDEVDAVVSSARLGILAPDPQVYLLAAGILQVPPGRCLYVGTEPDLLAGAKAAGMHVHRFRNRDGLARALR